MGAWLPRILQRRGPSVPRGGAAHLCLMRAPWACGRRGARVGAPHAGIAGPPQRGPRRGARTAAVRACPYRWRPIGCRPNRLALTQGREASPTRSVHASSRRGPCLGGPVAVAQACPSRRAPVWGRSAWRRRAAAGAVASPPTVPVSACVPGCRGAHGAAGGTGRSPDGRGRAPGRCSGGWGGTVSRAACVGVRVRCVLGFPQGRAPWTSRGPVRPGRGGAAGPNKGLQATASSGV